MVSLLLGVAFVLVKMSGTTQATAIATIVAAAIGGSVALVTQRSAAKTAAQNVAVTSRTDIEKAAFERASKYYEGALDRSDKEIERLGADVVLLERQVEDLQVRLRTVERANAAEIAELKAQKGRLLEELQTAKKLLALKYPDEK